MAFAAKQACRRVPEECYTTHIEVLSGRSEAFGTHDDAEVGTCVYCIYL